MKKKKVLGKLKARCYYSLTRTPGGKRRIDQGRDREGYNRTIGNTYRDGNQEGDCKPGVGSVVVSGEGTTKKEQPKKG